MLYLIGVVIDDSMHIAVEHLDGFFLGLDQLGERIDACRIYYWVTISLKKVDICIDLDAIFAKVVNKLL